MSKTREEGQFDTLLRKTRELASDETKNRAKNSEWSGVLIIAGKEDPKLNPLDSCYRALSYKRKENPKNTSEVKVYANQGFVIPNKFTRKYI